MKRQNHQQRQARSFDGNKKHAIFFRTVGGDPCIYCWKESRKVTKGRTSGWGEKVAQWVDRVVEWVDRLVAAPAEPVPIPVRPSPVDRRPRR